MEELGFTGLGHLIHDWAYAAGHTLPEQFIGFGEWMAKAAMDGVFGLALGAALIPVGEKIITPIWRAFTSKP